MEERQVRTGSYGAIQGDGMKSKHAIIRTVLSGRWLAPHDIGQRLWNAGCPISPESVTARVRDLRKPQYGRHTVDKRRRKGTTYYEYSIPTNQQQEA